MFKFTNFVTPGTIYHGTVAKGEAEGAEVSLKVYRETKVPGINTSDFETKQVRSLRGNSLPFAEELLGEWRA